MKRLLIAVCTLGISELARLLPQSRRCDHCGADIDLSTFSARMKSGRHGMDCHPIIYGILGLNQAEHWADDKEGTSC